MNSGPRRVTLSAAKRAAEFIGQRKVKYFCRIMHIKTDQILIFSYKSEIAGLRCNRRRRCGWIDTARDVLHWKRIRMITSDTSQYSYISPQLLTIGKKQKKFRTVAVKQIE